MVFFGEPIIPTPEQWHQYFPPEHQGTFDGEYSMQALQRIVTHREDIIGAAVRHGFIPKALCSADPQQKAYLYTLAAILYRESLGYDEENTKYFGAVGFLGEVAGDYGVARPDTGYMITTGIPQMLPTLAHELTEQGVVYEPRHSDGRINYNQEVVSPSRPEIIPSNNYADGGSIIEYTGTIYRTEVVRLQEVAWASEYVAANLDFGMRQENFWDPEITNYEGRKLSPTEKLASWYNGRVIDINREIIDDDDRPDIGARLSIYQFGTYQISSLFEQFDILGIKSMCDSSCVEYN